MAFYFTWRIYDTSPSISLYEMLTYMICILKMAHFIQLLDHSFSQLNLYRLHCMFHRFNVWWMFCGCCDMGLLPDTYNCGLRMRREWFFPVTVGKRCRDAPRHVRDVRAMMPISLTIRFLSRRLGEKHSRRTWCMRRPQVYVFGKRPILTALFEPRQHNH